MHQDVAILTVSALCVCTNTATGSAHADLKDSKGANTDSEKKMSEIQFERTVLAWFHFTEHMLVSWTSFARDPH